MDILIYGICLCVIFGGMIIIIIVRIIFVILTIISELLKRLKEFFARISNHHNLLYPQIKTESRKKAWKLLSNFLTEKQKLQISTTKSFTEEGKFGTYRLPINNDFGETECLKKIKFIPLYTKPLKLIMSWIKVFQMEERFVAMAITTPKGICLNNTAYNMEGYVPWYDVLVTLILYIRSGNELEFFKKGNYPGHQQ